jgi:hypothetical protein
MATIQGLPSNDAQTALRVEGLSGGVAASVTTTQLPAALGATTKAGSVSVTIATDQAPSTGTQSIVAGSATPVTILAANASRKGAAVFNDSSALLYLLVGSGTCSATVHTVQLAGGQYYELPLCTGGVPTVILAGMWASATGSARVTEWT